MSATFAQRQDIYSPILVAAFVKHGLPPEWGLALAQQESRFNPAAINNTGGDLARGGSRGICQMSWKTALGLGFKGVPDDLFNPSICADLAGQLCAELVRRWKTRNFADIAAGYNSGKPYAKAPSSTLTYVKNVLVYEAQYKPAATKLAVALANDVARQKLV